jgi:acyl-coenzyme A thioesterase PaaI-like protein
VSNAHLDILPPAAQLLGRDYLADGRIRYTARPEFTNRHGIVQGGFLAAMLDSATSFALLRELEPEFIALTMTLETSFLKPAPVGDFFATVRLLSRDAKYAQSEAELATAEGLVVASAKAKLRILPRRS